MKVIFGYFWSVVSAAAAGAVVWGLSQLAGLPAWVWVMAIGASVPLFVFLSVTYLGGIVYGYNKIFAGAKETGKELE